MSLRVLLGLDDSPYCLAATSVALDLVRRLPEAQLTALHVLNVRRPSGSFFRDLPGKVGFEPAVVSEELYEEHRARGQALLDRAGEAAAEAGVAIELLLDEGPIVERLVHHGEHHDVVVLGALGETEVRFPGQGGSHIAELLSDLSVEVLLVPPGVSATHTAVLGYDGSPAAKHALRALLRLGDAVERVHAVFVDHGEVEDAESLLSEVDRAFGANKVTHHVLTGGGVREGLLHVARNEGAELLAVGFKGKTRLRDFFEGQSAHELLHRDDLMLLVAH